MFCVTTGTKPPPPDPIVISDDEDVEKVPFLSDVRRGELYRRRL